MIDVYESIRKTPNGDASSTHLGICEHVNGRSLEDHGPLPNLVALSRHDISEEVVDVLLDEPQLKDLLRDISYGHTERFPPCNG